MRHFLLVLSSPVAVLIIFYKCISQIYHTLNVFAFVKRNFKLPKIFVWFEIRRAQLFDHPRWLLLTRDCRRRLQDSTAKSQLWARLPLIALPVRTKRKSFPNAPLWRAYRLDSPILYWLKTFHSIRWHQYYYYYTECDISEQNELMLITGDFWLRLLEFLASKQWPDKS